ncbi:biotin/lipoyl-containing protein [Flavobacteriaceae bacterium 3-367]
MDNQFRVVVNGSMEIEITKETVLGTDVVKTAPQTYHIIKDNTSYHGALVQADFNAKKYRVKINNNTYEVVLLDSLDQLIKKMGFALASSKNISVVDAPMPGLILDIHVSKGQTVRENDPLLILEAMKMENIITSPRDGVIKEVAVKKGEAVDKKHLLISFE